MITKTEVLNKVKKLFLIPELNVVTVRQVAEYYEVDIGAIQMLYQRNKDEINADGMIIKKSCDFLSLTKCLTQSTRKIKGNKVYLMSDGMELVIPNSSIKCFSQRAVLRIGMLLRDSEVAKEVRTQLLNTFEHSTVEQKTADITEESSLMMNLGRAVASGDFNTFVTAVQEYNLFQNRHISKLESENTKLVKDNEILVANNKAMSEGILQWSERAQLNKLVRKLANLSHEQYSHIWSALYNELSYKYGISLRQRGKSPFIQYVTEKEWDNVSQCFAAICENRGIDSAVLINDMKKINMQTTVLSH